MLSWNQKYSVVAQFCCGTNKEKILQRMADCEVFSPSEMDEVRILIDKVTPLIKKRNGYIPKTVLELIK